jgi:hypothetical protein
MAGLEDWYTGNINLLDRPVVRNGRDYSTVASLTVGEPGNYSVIPTVIPTEQGGKLLSPEQAVAKYYEDLARGNAQYLGKGFNTIDEANSYADRVHQQQQDYYGDRIKFYQTLDSKDDAIRNYLAKYLNKQ